MKYRRKPQQSPRWSIKGSACIDVPNEPTRWELFLLAENLEDSKLDNNSKVLKFVKQNWDKFYIPTNVLKMYGMDGEL